MSATNRPELSRTLSNLLQIKGTMPGLESGDRLVPTLDIVGAVARSPYAEFALPVGRMGANAAVAAENGYTWISPGVNICLTPLIFRITLVAGTTAPFRVVVLTQADQTTIGVTAFSRLVRLRQRLPGVASPNFPEFTQSVIDMGTNAGLIGTFLDRFQVGDREGATRDIDMSSYGAALYGDIAGAGNIQGLGVVCETVNVGFDVGVTCLEWPQPF